MKQIKIGVLVNTHGLKGEVRVKSLTDFPELRFAKGNTIHVQFKNELLTVKIKHVRENKGLLLISFDGYDDINQVEAWKGSILSIDESEVHALAEDEAYFFELRDCQVIDAQGKDLGVVTEIIETGANAVLRVKKEEHEILIPYVHAFVKNFDRTNKVLTVELMDGML